MKFKYIHNGVHVTESYYDFLIDIKRTLQIFGSFNWDLTYCEKKT
jgi:hypothetical protein